MADIAPPVHHRLMRWLLELLERPEDSWDDGQRAFLISLLGTPEGAGTLGKLAATTTRLRKTGFPPSRMGDLGAIHSALEEFWNDPSPETYRNLGIARW